MRDGYEGYPTWLLNTAGWGAVGFAILFVIPFVATVLHVIGAIKAYNGEQHWSPLTLRFVR